MVAESQEAAGSSVDAVSTGTFVIEARYEMDRLEKFWDVRFDDGSKQLLVGSRGDGVIRFARTPELRALERGIATRPNGRFSASAWRVGSSDQVTVAGQVVGSISWMPRGDRKLRVFHGFDAIVDLDVFGTTVAVMAARRDGRDGAYAEDGSIVSIGTLGEALENLRPLHSSIDGPGAQTFERCFFLQTGQVRFLRDGRLIVSPGGEPGIYRYRQDGILEKTWQTDRLGLDTECGFTDGESNETGGDLDMQLSWLNRHTIVDDLVPLHGGIGLIVREIESGQATWQLWILHRRDEVSRHRLPFRRPPYQRIRADADGDRIALLFSNWTMTNPIPQDIVVLSMTESAKNAPIKRPSRR